jgi:hypothetical protein
VRPGRAALLIVSAVACYAVGVWLSLAYWRWGLIPLAAVAYLAAAYLTATAIVETLRGIFQGVSFGTDTPNS